MGAISVGMIQAISGAHAYVSIKQAIIQALCQTGTQVQVSIKQASGYLTSPKSISTLSE